MGARACSTEQSTLGEIFSNTNQEKVFSSIVMKCSTWAKDSFGLYDYTNSEISRRTFKCAGPIAIHRKDNEVFLCQISQPPQDRGVERLATISYSHNSYVLQPMPKENEERDNNMYIILKRKEAPICDPLNISYELRQNTVFKLGRMKLKVIDIVEKPELEEEKMKFSIKNSYSSPESDKIEECRFCRTTIETEDNPLISPCKCSGSIKYVHVGCLREWYRNKCKVNINLKATTYEISKLECELCKFQFSSVILYNSKEIPLVDLELPHTKPYMLLESVFPPECKYIVVVTLGKNDSLNIGRKSDTDVQFSEVSISRHHAQLKSINGKYFLQDQESKFGTLIEIERPLEISDKYPMSVQIGKSVISLIKKTPRIGKPRKLSVPIEGLVNPHTEIQDS